MKQRTELAAMAILFAVLLMGALLLFGETTQAALPYAVPTSIPDIRPVPGDAVSRDYGGIFSSGIAIDGGEDEYQLYIEAYASQTQDIVNIANSSGTELFAIESDGEVVAKNLPRVATKAITYTAAAGGNGNVLVIPAGDKAFIHSVLVNVTTNFDATGDDATLDIGDANDADGYIDLADAELQAADTEGTGFTAGWQGMTAATLGAYLDANHNAFVVDGSTNGYTMTYAIDEVSGETLSAGAATIYVWYTPF